MLLMQGWHLPSTWEQTASISLHVRSLFDMVDCVPYDLKTVSRIFSNNSIFLSLIMTLLCFAAQFIVGVVAGLQLEPTRVTVIR